MNKIQYSNHHMARTRETMQKRFFFLRQLPETAERKKRYKYNEKSILVKTDITAKRFSNSNIKKY